MKPHVFHPDADAEYGEAARFYALIDQELGARFYEEIERLIREIRRQPDLHRRYDNKVRRHFSTTFPYAVLYLDTPDRVWIVAVMHMKRKPGYWKQRLGESE